MITPNTLLWGDPDNGGTVAEAIARGGKENEPYFAEVRERCDKSGVSFRVAVAQWDLETNTGRSDRWKTNRNPAGLLVEADADADPATFTLEEAAKVHVWALLYLTRRTWTQTYPPPNAKAFEDRWVAKCNDPNLPRPVVTVADLQRRYVDAAGEPQATWGWDGVEPHDPKTYAEKLVERCNAIFKETPMPSKPTILVIAGHRSHGDAGNPNEKALTPALARSYRDAFRAAGFDCTWLQEADGDADPDDTVGGLDTVSAKAAQWLAKQPGDCILFDLHYEGSPARGCFAIIPDVTGLRTGAPAHQDPADTWEANVFDRQLGRALVDGIAKRTGLSLRQGIREPGLMDESQTGVGGQGYRLATFAYTSPYRAKAVRLVVEHGNHTHPADMAIIARDDFSDLCAAAAVDAVLEVYGGTVVDPTPGYATPAPIPYEPGDIGWYTLDGRPVYALVAEVVARKGAVRRAWASGDAPKAGPTLKNGEKVMAIGSFAIDRTDDKGRVKPERWVLLEDTSRVRGSSLSPALPIKP